MFFN
jgi:hypothetical protein